MNIRELVVDVASLLTLKYCILHLTSLQILVYHRMTEGTPGGGGGGGGTPIYGLYGDDLLNRVWFLSCFS